MSEVKKMWMTNTKYFSGLLQKKNVGLFPEFQQLFRKKSTSARSRPEISKRIFLNFQKMILEKLEES